MNKLIYALNQLKYTILIFVVILLIALGLVIYSTETAKAFCKEKGMKYFDIIQENTLDPLDDVICWTKTDMVRAYSDKVVAEEIKLYYFERD